MPATEPELQMILPCHECRGSGQRQESLAGGAQVVSSGGGPLRYLTCDGTGEIPRRVALTELRTMLAS
jgi:hypothetical protein